MKKKNVYKINVAIVLILILNIIMANSFLYVNYKKHNTSFLDMVTVFNQKVELKPNIYVYEVNVKSGSLKIRNNKCEIPFTYEVSKIYKKSYSRLEANHNLDNKTSLSLDYVINDDKYSARYHFLINIEELIVPEECKPETLE